MRNIFIDNYRLIQDKRLREFIRQRLNKPIAFPNDADDNSYHHSFSRYRRFLENRNGEYRNYALTIKEIGNEKNHTPRPYCKEGRNNLKNISNRKYSKYDYQIFQIKTNSGILIEILKVNIQIVSVLIMK